MYETAKTKLQVIPGYLNNVALKYYRFLLGQTKGNIEFLKTALWDRYHTWDHPYDMWVKLH